MNTPTVLTPNPSGLITVTIGYNTPATNLSPALLAGLAVKCPTLVGAHAEQLETNAA